MLIRILFVLCLTNVHLSAAFRQIIDICSFEYTAIMPNVIDLTNPSYPKTDANRVRNCWCYIYSTTYMTLSAVLTEVKYSSYHSSSYAWIQLAKFGTPNTRFCLSDSKPSTVILPPTNVNNIIVSFDRTSTWYNKVGTFRISVKADPDGTMLGIKCNHKDAPKLQPNDALIKTTRKISTTTTTTVTTTTTSTTTTTTSAATTTTTTITTTTTTTTTPSSFITSDDPHERLDYIGDLTETTTSIPVDQITEFDHSFTLWETDDWYDRSETFGSKPSIEDSSGFTETYNEDSKITDAQTTVFSKTTFYKNDEFSSEGYKSDNISKLSAKISSPAGVSRSAVVGISIGVIIFISILIVATFFFVKKLQSQKIFSCDPELSRTIIYSKERPYQMTRLEEDLGNESY